MFDFYGTTDRLRFLRAMAVRLLWLGVFTLGYPYIHVAILRATGCDTTSCGAVGVVAALAIKPTAVILVLLSLPAPLVCRSRDAGLPPWLGLFPLIFALREGLALALVGAPWGMSFALGMIGPRQIPWNLLFAVWLIVVVGALPTRPRRDWKATPPDPVEIVTLAALAFLALASAVGLSLLTPAGHLLLPLARLLSIVFYPVVPLRLVVVATTAWSLWSALRDRNPSPAGVVTADPTAGTDPQHFGRRGIPPAETTATPPDTAGLRVPVGSIVAIATVTAVIQWFAATSARFDLLRFVLDVSAVVIPTAAIDALLLAALWIVVARPTRWSALLLVVALAPFALWAREATSDRRALAAQTAEIAAVPVTPLVSRPDTLVIRASNHVDISRLVAAGGFTTVLVERDDHTYRDATPRPRAARQTGSADEKIAPPAEYLVLSVGTSSSFARKAAGDTPMPGPFELRFHTPTRDDLVAVSYDRIGPPVDLLPILGLAGWRRDVDRTIPERWQTVPVELVGRAVAGLPARR